MRWRRWKEAAMCCGLVLLMQGVVQAEVAEVDVAADERSAAAARAAAFDYQLRPRPLADGVYLLEGRLEDFSSSNGGNIVNTGFIVGDEGVIVIDSGPSRRYGEQLRAAIAAITPLPVRMVINTHPHPDHVLGNQAFDPQCIAGLAPMIEVLAQEGEGLLDNMYRLVGEWMEATTIVVPTRAVQAGVLEIGGRQLELFALSGHTNIDLLVRDLKTGVLFAGDLVFSRRAPATPQASFEAWRTALDTIRQLDFSVLVPGHGPVQEGQAAIEQTMTYLHWLEDALRTGAQEGLEINEMLALPLPPALAGLAVAQAEYQRAVLQLYPAHEQAALQVRR